MPGTEVYCWSAFQLLLIILLVNCGFLFLYGMGCCGPFDGWSNLVRQEKGQTREVDGSSSLEVCSKIHSV